jgi:hypothetical protein
MSTTTLVSSVGFCLIASTIFLDGKIMKADQEWDFLRMGENFYIGFLYGDVPDESEFF